MSLRQHLAALGRIFGESRACWEGAQSEAASGDFVDTVHHARRLNRLSSTCQFPACRHRAASLETRKSKSVSTESRRPMAAQYAYVMKGMTKTFPGAPKPVLSNINLQFYQDAKIGIVGPNGTGKSTLMKIMAGIDTEFTGEAWPGENITVGYLAQEPQLDSSKTVKENVMDGVREVADLVGRFNEISMIMGDPPEDVDFDALMDEMGTLAGKNRRGRWLDAR